jgi:hypothetical protein
MMVENNVWLPSSQDGIVQRFSHDGSKLLLQIGTKGVVDSSDGIAVDRANGGGNGNRRGKKGED